MPDQTYDLSLLNISGLRDQLNSAPVVLTANCCMAVISSLQSCPHKGSMLAGLTAAFVLVSELTGIRIPDIITATKNAMTDGQARLPQFAASQDFIAKEILSR